MKSSENIVGNKYTSMKNPVKIILEYECEEQNSFFGLEIQKCKRKLKKIKFKNVPK